MSQGCDTADLNGEGSNKGLTAEALQRYMVALAEDRDASAERTEGILARFFKVAIVMVCLNVVIAGANVAMILVRPHAVATPPPAATPGRTETTTETPTAPAVITPAACAAAPASSSETQAPVAPMPASNSAVSDTPATSPKPEAAPIETDKKVPLLGPLPTPKVATAGVPMLARRPARPIGRPSLGKPFLSDDDDQSGDESPLGRPERW